MVTELQALQNAANSAGLNISQKFTDDKRRTVNKYYASLNGVSISPVLDYEQLNCFLLGWIKCKQTTN